MTLVIASLERLRVVLHADDDIVAAALTAVDEASATLTRRPGARSTAIRWKRGTVTVPAGTLVLAGGPGRGTGNRRIQISAPFETSAPQVDEEAIRGQLRAWRTVLECRNRIPHELQKETDNIRARHVSAALYTIHNDDWSTATVTPALASRNAKVVVEAGGRVTVYRRPPLGPEDTAMSPDFAELLSDADLVHVEAFHAPNVIVCRLGPPPPFPVENTAHAMARMHLIREGYDKPPLAELPVRS